MTMSSPALWQNEKTHELISQTTARQTDETIGAVKLNGQSSFYAGIVAEWILDYQAYDPKFASSGAVSDFRGGLLRVDETNADKFREAMRDHQFSVEEISALRADSNAEETPLTVVIDFDRKLFVNGFYDLAIEEYVPENWRGVLDNPLDYLPEELQKVWRG